ncbi:MAG: PBSX family phage terminase large subunit [Oscillospiraceae bacterium]|nr:PBSX family phage terminase large subunit [Oscillospiraceae bacterium]
MARNHSITLWRPERNSRELTFSPKQLQVLTWWCDQSPVKDCEAIICDGAVRSGKTLCMGLSFVCWAMRRFDGAQFAFCGKTQKGIRRNLLASLQAVVSPLGFLWEEKVSQDLVEISFGGRRNTFYLFGGKDEGAAALIQGATFAGVLLDEAALMPRSFVEQACARCSVEGARLWFNCNPEGPHHWFYREWIQQAGRRKALYLHFTMEDNPSLSPATIERYQRLYTGNFYRRFVLGEWAAPQGLVYDFFDEKCLGTPDREPEEFAISCDYGTRNPASFGLWGRVGSVWYRMEEFYYDSRRTGRQRTDAEYEQDLRRLAGERTIRQVVVDPSAASFIEVLRRKGWRAVKADNDVLAGIRLTASLLRNGTLKIGPGCTDSLREFQMYSWDERFGGQDQVKKEFDHAMDDIRYFAATVAGPRDPPFFGVATMERDRF